jgi:hypothetical protein
MIFQAAYSYMKRGHDIKLPEWGGFWRWNPNTNSIIIHTRTGGVLDIRDTQDVDYTISFMFRTDWELIN